MVTLVDDRVITRTPPWWLSPPRVNRKRPSISAVREQGTAACTLVVVVAAHALEGAAARILTVGSGAVAPVLEVSVRRSRGHRNGCGGEHCRTRNEHEPVSPRLRFEMLHDSCATSCAPLPDLTGVARHRTRAAFSRCRRGKVEATRVPDGAAASAQF